MVFLQTILRNHSKKSKIGTLSERLGIGLQNRLEQFDSARYLFFYAYNIRLPLTHILVRRQSQTKWKQS